jgi:hypothetical protein
MPLLTTPNHPEYPAAHTCLTGAEAEMYTVVLGTHHIDVTIRGSADGTPNNWSVIHTFETVNDLQREVVNARVWAGLHYRGSALEGLELARQVARWALRRYFLPASDHYRRILSLGLEANDSPSPAMRLAHGLFLGVARNATKRRHRQDWSYLMTEHAGASSGLQHERLGETDKRDAGS